MLTDMQHLYSYTLLKFKVVSPVDSERPKQPLESVVGMCNSGLGPHPDIMFSGELEWLMVCVLSLVFTSEFSIDH